MSSGLIEALVQGFLNSVVRQEEVAAQQLGGMLGLDMRAFDYHSLLVAPSRGVINLEVQPCWEAQESRPARGRELEFALR